MRHLNLFVILTLMYFSWNAFAQVATVQDKCGFYKTDLGKKAAITKYIENAGVNCKDHPGFSQKYDRWNTKLVDARAKEYFAAEEFFNKKSSTGCTSGFSEPVDAYSKWVTTFNNLSAQQAQANRSAFCSQAMVYIDQKLGIKTSAVSKDVSPVSQIEKPIQLASVDTRPEPVVEKPVRREQTAAVAVSSSSSFRSSGGLSGPSSLAYTSAYSNLLPTGYQQPMFVQMMVNQMIFVPGIGYRPVIQPMIVPLRQGVR